MIPYASAAVVLFHSFCYAVLKQSNGLVRMLAEKVGRKLEVGHRIFFLSAVYSRETPEKRAVGQRRNDDIFGHIERNECSI